MFPTIFSLATKGLGKFTNAASGVLCTAIVGGAVVPVIQGWAADTYTLMSSFVVSVICYLYIVFLRCTDIGRTNNLFLRNAV